MNVLSIENLSKTLKDEPLFSDVSLGLEEGDHVGLIGSNGTGKTTFLRLIAGLIPPDEGSIAINRKCETVLLEQEVTFDQNDTILQYLLSGSGQRSRTFKSYLAAGSQKEMDRLSDELDRIDGWNLEKDFEIFLAELAVTEDTSTPMRSLSGGTQKKVSLARLFAMRPSLILMDEPTNHLDIASIRWLEDKFASSPATIIVVTHDRYFLNKVCSQIIEIDSQTMFTHPGNYTAFLERRAERIAALNKEQDRLATILRRELEWLKRGPKARAGKDSSRKQRISDMLDAQQTVEKAPPADFTSISRRLGKKILELDDISKSFGDKKIVSDFTFSFTKGTKIGIIGANGSGKSTFLDIATQTIPPDSGLVDKGVNTFFSYYDQQSRKLPLEKSMLDYISDISEMINLGSGNVVTAARFLELFGFDKSFHRLPISVLSGGEKRRLYLISCLVDNPNFLVLDEPTNDLDIDTISRLEQYIIDFDGCVLEVSHDRAFLDQTCDRLFVFKGNGVIENFEGNYSSFLEQESPSQPVESDSDSSKRENQHSSRKGLSYRQQQRFDEVSSQIEALEAEKAKLEGFFSSGTADNLEEPMRRYKEIGTLLESLNSEWEELAALA